MPSVMLHSLDAALHRSLVLNDCFGSEADTRRSQFVAFRHCWQLSRGFKSCLARQFLQVVTCDAYDRLPFGGDFSLSTPMQRGCPLTTGPVISFQSDKREFEFLIHAVRAPLSVSPITT